MATAPISAACVSGPPYPKLDPALRPERIASAQSQWWFLTRVLLGRAILAGVSLHHTLREQPATDGPVRTVHNLPFVAKENGPRARHLVVGGEILGPGNGIVAVVPDQFDGATLVAGRKLVSDLRGGRIAQTLFRRVIIGEGVKPWTGLSRYASVRRS
jgi:hypothetical protein